jgi:Cytochrome c554 and c-prime
VSGTRSRWLAVIFWLLGALFALAAPAGAAAEHEGVATCSGSTCHGRLAPNPHGVRQNEISTWQDVTSPAGAHSRAWQVLDNPRSHGIADRLGIGSAQTSPQCLGCHVDPAAARGPKFQVSDGVGCEACHGGSIKWLASHTALHVTHAANVAAGMTALEQPKVRAAVCLNCHFGSADQNQFVSHRLMAAGHPRISFELDLFSELQRHYDVDSYYAARKTIAGGVKIWAVGQAMALERTLSLYNSPRGSQGVFPEFTFFDCYSCHRTISNDPNASVRAVANPGRPIPIGTPPFNDSNIIMLVAAVRAIAPDLAEKFEAQARAFHLALAESRESAIHAAGELAQTAHELADKFAAHRFSRDETFAILDQLTSDALSARYTDYAGSEQAVMAIDTLRSALVAGQMVKLSDAKAIGPEIAHLYDDVKDPNSYHPAEFRKSLERVAAALKGLH